MSKELRDLETKARSLGPRGRGMIFGGNSTTAMGRMAQGQRANSVGFKKRSGSGLVFGSKPKKGKERLVGRLAAAENYLAQRSFRRGR